MPKQFEVLIDKTYLFKVECKNNYNGKFEQSFRVKKVCMDEKVIESFTDVEVKSLVRSYLFLFTSYPIYSLIVILFLLDKIFRIYTLQMRRKQSKWANKSNLIWFHCRGTWRLQFNLFCKALYMLIFWSLFLGFADQIRKRIKSCWDSKKSFENYSIKPCFCTGIVE